MQGKRRKALAKIKNQAVNTLSSPLITAEQQAVSEARLSAFKQKEKKSEYN